MNYDAFMEPVTWFLTGMEKHSDSYNGGLWGDGEAFFNAMKYHMSRMQPNTCLLYKYELSVMQYTPFTITYRRTTVSATARTDTNSSS